MVGFLLLVSCSISSRAASNVDDRSEVPNIEKEIPRPDSWAFPDIVESARAISPTNLEGRPFNQFGMAYSTSELEKLNVVDMSAEKLQVYADIVTHAYPDAVFEQMPGSCAAFPLDQFNETAIAGMAYISIHAVEEGNRKRARECLLNIQHRMKQDG